MDPNTSNTSTQDLREQAMLQAQLQGDQPQKSQEHWARFKCLMSDSNLQIVAMERLQALL